MNVKTDILCEKAIMFLSKYSKLSEINARKPRLMHAVRVGMYLYDHGYGDDIVVAGFLHDVIEWEGVTIDMIDERFGEYVRSLVLANTKDRTHGHPVDDMIKRCVACGEDALIVKAADIIDSFVWYMDQKNDDELQNHCVNTAQSIMMHKPERWRDKLFDELTMWRKKCDDLL